MAIDFEGEGLLAGCRDAGERSARLKLLEHLTERGVELEELRRAVGEQRLTLLPVELELQGELKYTPEQVAEISGLPMELLERNWRALGMSIVPDGHVGFTEEDLDAAKRVALFLQGGLTEEAIVENARVIGQAMSRVAAATRDVVGPALQRAGDSELSLGQRYAQAGAALTPLMAQTLNHLYRRHLLEGIRRDVITQAELESGASGNARPVAAAFADLCDFTRLGETLPVSELGALAGRLVDLAGEAVSAPVDLVKTIGDAVMLVCEEPEPLVEVCLELVARADAEPDDFPQLKAGVALGPALPRGGDWYGRSINLAARVTGIARPGSVLTTEEVKDAMSGEQHDWSFAGERRLKGIEGGVKVFRVRPGAVEPSE